MKSNSYHIIPKTASLFALVVLLASTSANAGDQPLTASTDIPLTENHSFWLWNFLGRLHPLMVHFPVSLIFFAAVLELVTVRRFDSRFRPVINFLLGMGVLSAALSVPLGLLLARDGDYGKLILGVHQWTGIATTVLGAATLLLLFYILRRNRLALIRPYRTLVFVTAVGICVAGHFGASLTHGSDYLSSTLPWSDDYQPTPANRFDFAAYKHDTVKLGKKEELELNVQVRSILAHNCYKCHGPEKVKGELRLDSKKLVFKGGENGPVVVAGDPVKSEMYRRISLPANHKDVMPSKGKKLSQTDIEVIKFWIEKGAPWPDNAGNQTIYRVAKMEPRNPPLPAATQELQNPVDRWVNEYFRKKKIAWSAPVDDRTYLKRIFLDIVGLLPSPDEQATFARDPSRDKRSAWARKLLSRDDDYALNWLTFWNDALRNDYTGTGYITGGRFNITEWLYASLRANKPYDAFVRELISPDKRSDGFIKGIKWRGVVNASQRTEMQAAQNVSQVFFGLNLKCASCHNSFISDWKLEDAYGFANIFSDTLLEINRCDKPSGKYTVSKMLWKELGYIDSVGPAAKKQEQLAGIMVKPEDGRLYRTIVNRIWAQLMGRGLVEPVDVMDNEPWSQDLLDWIAVNFVSNKADLKELIYMIVTSKTYQLPSVGFKEPNEVFAKEYTFKGPLRKRMTAEQFSDAVSSIVGPLFPDSLIRFNPFATAAKNTARPSYPRASLVMNNVFLTALGRPNRETVSTSRESQANLLQALELTNGDRFNEALRKGALIWQKKYSNSDVMVTDLYVRALGRQPQQKELSVAKKVLGNAPGTEAIEDLFWAVMLLPEFQIIY